MPSWSVHLVTANKLLEKLNVDRNSFVFANVLPDINNAYFIEGVRNKLSHKETHFTKDEDLKDIKFNYNNVKRFKQEYYNKLDNPVVLGYLTHLLADSYWNEMAFNEHYIYNGNKDFIGVKLSNNVLFKCTKEEGTHIKQEEFKVFGNYLIHKYKVEYPIYTEKLVNEANEITENKIWEEDIKKSIEYINNSIKNWDEIKNFEYKMFTKEELQKRFDSSIDFILSNIK